MKIKSLLVLGFLLFLYLAVVGAKKTLSFLADRSTNRAACLEQLKLPQRGVAHFSPNPDSPGSWRLRLSNTSKHRVYYRLASLRPAIAGIETPHIFRIEPGVEQAMTTLKSTHGSFEVIPSMSFAFLSKERLSELLTSPYLVRYPVLGESKITETKNIATGQLWHIELGLDNAVDIDADIGAPVVAMRSGEVVFVENRYADLGCNNNQFLKTSNAIQILHEDGTEATYGHLKQFANLVEEGDIVKAGQQIASVGNSGSGKKPHLHFHVAGMTDLGFKTIPVKFLPCGNISKAWGPEPKSVSCNN